MQLQQYVNYDIRKDGRDTERGKSQERTPKGEAANHPTEPADARGRKEQQRQRQKGQQGGAARGSQPMAAQDHPEGTHQGNSKSRQSRQAKHTSAAGGTKW